MRSIAELKDDVAGAADLKLSPQLCFNAQGYEFQVHLPREGPRKLQPLEFYLVFGWARGMGCLGFGV